MNTDTLYYIHPAKYWMDALPLGNGTLGAMCYSGVGQDKITLNHDTLWSGHPRKIEKPGAYESWKKAQKLALEGQYASSQKELEDNFLTCWSQAYMPFGDLLLEFGDTAFSEYERKLSLAKAILTSQYVSEENCIRKTAFVSYPQGVFVYHIEADRPIAFTARLQCPLRSKVYVEDGILMADGECPGDCGSTKSEYPCNDHRYFENDKERGIQFRGAVQVVSDGKVIEMQDTLRVENATCVTLYVTIATSYNGFNKYPAIEGKEYKARCLKTLKDACALGYAAVREAHVKDYKEYYDRVSLRIGQEENLLLPTDERLMRFAVDKNDPALYTLLFNFGRYLLIASSRPGSLATNLQGIWNNSLKPAWNSNYTININTEMNYWPVMMCGLGELMEPLENLIRMLSVTGRDVAREFYHADGFVSHHNADIWGFATPVWNRAVYGFWSGSSGWLCRSLFEKYEYTLDKNYLKNTALPLMQEAAKFYLDILVEDDKDELIICPATSPENSFIVDGESVAVAQSTAMMNSIVLDLLLGCKRACEDLGISDEFYDRVVKAIPRIKRTVVGEDGRLLEWDEPLEEAEIHHRHVSHLYALHPAGIITPEDEERFAACRKTLETRGDDGTGWSLAWKINFWARLRDGDHALNLVDQLLRLVDSANTDNPVYTGGGGVYPNMLDAHPPFQIDGNFGAVSGIGEMLLQSDGKNIWLLPALPDAWCEGEVRGLAARGGVTVDMTWRDGKLTSYTIHGNVDDLNIICCK